METSADNRFKDILSKITYVILIASSLFIMYTSGFGLLSAMSQRTIHWLFMVVAIFLLYPATKKGRINVTNVILAVLAAATTVYVFLSWEQNALRINDPTLIETAICIAGIILVLEATRRSMGIAMPIIAVISLLYAYLGPYLPGFFRHKGFSVVDLMSFLFTTTEGVFGLAMGTSATYIVIFVLFGAFLSKSGAGQLFVDLSMCVTGKSRSGPARATILSNALMGIISGSPVANVVTTGSFTLPMLESTKYPMIQGAALLAVAACGSMFTPPVMGAAAFLIADYIGTDYGNVILAALIPAMLFYVSLFVYADVGAAKNGLTGVKREDLVDWKKALVERGHMLIPIILLVTLIVLGWSPLKSAFWCVLLIFALSYVRKATRMSIKNALDALSSGSKDSLSIASACASSGIVVGVISMTGLGVKFSSLLMQLAQNNIFLALLLTMVAALILGMGLPPTAVYIVMAALTVPALINMGITPMAAHFFVFYFSCVGAITPPVALAAYSAAAIAKTDPFRTGWAAFRMGLVAYIVPFIFAFNPILLLQFDQPLFDTLLAIVTATVGVVFLTFGIEGYFRKRLSIIPQLLFLAGAVLLMIPGLVTDIIGVGCIAAGIVLSKFIKGKELPPTEMTEPE